MIGKENDARGRQGNRDRSRGRSQSQGRPTAANRHAPPRAGVDNLASVWGSVPKCVAAIVAGGGRRLVHEIRAIVLQLTVREVVKTCRGSLVIAKDKET
jgi:hypothetical protein